MVVRLGGEGHRALVSPLPDFQTWQKLAAYEQHKDRNNFAYLLTPGLAEKNQQCMEFIQLVGKTI